MPGKRPAFGEPFSTFYDWLRRNDVDEWLPEFPTVRVDLAAATIGYTAFRWDGPRGWDPEHLAVAGDHANSGIEWRAVPLRVPPGEAEVAAASQGGVKLLVA